MPKVCCQPGAPPAPASETPPPRPGLPALPGELPASLTAGALLLAGFALSHLAPPGFVQLAGEALIWISLAIGMVYGGRAAWESLREKRFDIDVLMIVAAALAAWLGHPEDGSLLLFLFTLAGALEDRAMRRTKRAVEALHKLMPREALVQRDGDWVRALPEALVPGDRVLIRTGELVPADARVADGFSSIDQATLTGESMPRPVQPGDEIYAGTINAENPIEAVVTKPAAQSSLQRVLNLVIEAQQQREPMQRLIDRLDQPYAIGVFLVSIAVLLAWWLVLGRPLITEDGAGGALYTAITLLIVGSPCALVIATPTATLAAISRAARAGMLFKGGQAIERLAATSAVCLDKTGTITFGRPRLHQVHPVAWSDGAALLAVAAGMEQGSTHPIAAAILDAAAVRNVEPAPISELTNVMARGLSGVASGRPVRLGTYAHAEPLIPVCLRARVREVLEKVRERGQIAVVIAWADPADERFNDAADNPAGQAAVLIMSDEIRPGAAPMIDDLHALGVRPICMLTGDHALTAERVARQVGLDCFHAELIPEEKVREVERIKEQARAGKRAGSRLAGRGSGGVAYIGDGVNDAPALAAADVSVAIGSIGSDAALETADIVLLNDDLTIIPWAVRLARRTRGIILFNILLAVGVIIGFGAVTLIGSLTGYRLPLPIAVLAHEGGTLLVVLNSLRLLLMPRPTTIPEPPPRPGETAQGAPELAVGAST